MKSGFLANNATQWNALFLDILQYTYRTICFIKQKSQISGVSKIYTNKSLLKTFPKQQNYIKSCYWLNVHDMVARHRHLSSFDTHAIISEWF